VICSDRCFLVGLKMIASILHQNILNACSQLFDGGKQADLFD
jgi:hypothetical protein